MLWAFEEREKLMHIHESACGSRLHAAYYRVGGVHIDIPDDLIEKIEKWADEFPKFMEDMKTLLNDNRIFKQRSVDIGIISPDEAKAWGMSGPVLRGSGIAWDIRKSEPYDVYYKMDFHIPIGKNGDCYSRYLVRVAEMEESLKIIKQCLRDMPPRCCNV